MRKYIFLSLIFVCLISMVYLIQSIYHNHYYAIRLTRAIENYDLKRLEYLLEKRGNIDAKTHVICIDCVGDIPALHTAACLENYEAVKLLVDHGTNVNNTNAVNQLSPLNSALSCQDDEMRLKISRYLIESGANINYRSNNGNGENALAATLKNYYNQYSFERDQAQLTFIIWLIEQGGNVHNTGSYGNLIFYAAVNNNVLVVEYLLDHDIATINLQNDSGYTALMFACRSNAKEVVMYLLNNEANKELRNDDGRRAIEIALENDNLEIFTLLNE